MNNPMDRSDPNFEVSRTINTWLVEHPWQIAEEGSIWRVWGNYSDGGTFSDCLAVVLPKSVTGGLLLFHTLPPLGRIFTSDAIKRGIEMQLIVRYP